jgi:diacylglycerol kinase
MIDIQKFIRSVGFALEGIVSLIKSENNARIHFLATVLVIIAGVYFQISSNDWLWIALAITLVWLAEAFNTSIESLADFVSTEKHPMVKKVKDIAAAGVLFAAVFAVIVAVMVFLF